MHNKLFIRVQNEIKLVVSYLNWPPPYIIAKPLHVNKTKGVVD